MAGILGDLRHPFFRPAWRRIAIVAVAGLWGLFELSTGAVFWGVLFLGIAGLAAYEFHRAYEGDWSGPGPGGGPS